MIEKKSLQIVTKFKELTNSNMLTQNTKILHQPNIMLTFDDFEDNEEYNKILTAEELREKAKDFIEKEQNQKQKKKEARPKKK